MPTAATGAGQRRTSIWPRYDAAVTGLRNYWYPATWSRAVGKRPLSIQLLDEQIVLLRENGRLYALFDQCTHRGIPLSVGRREFAGTWTCRYHGWTFDLETGLLKAVITDGPDSPICGKVRVKTYPVEERLGLIWVYMGDGEPPPVEDDIPSELRQPEMVIFGRVSMQQGNWRYACENAQDEGHAKYLHRYGTVATLFRLMPAWSTVKVIPDTEGWISRETKSVTYDETYGDLGPWPPKLWWKRHTRGSRISMRLPCILRNHYIGKEKYKITWHVPVGKDQYRYVQVYAAKAPGLAKVKEWLYFWSYYRWAQLIQFNAQDTWMVELMPETPPERLYRPDVSITAWRKLCEHARGAAPTAAPLAEELAILEEEEAAEAADELATRG
jgi:phenylpropionate dioxygenase-like ring-hydroxylating dioxygenase large terminal subunit